MKIVAIGMGQAGGNIADEFYALNSYAESIFNRRIEIVTDAFALNTDEADLGGFRHIPKDKAHRILIGSKATFGHGVGKVNMIAAEIIKASNTLVTDTILNSAKFHEADAVMTIASAAGGTGSGTIGWTIKSLKERIDKPVYAIIILPFLFEEKGDTSFGVMNTATCINTALKYADCIFLVDNERYRKPETDLVATFHDVNKDIVGGFYDLCCAGEERNPRYIGGKVVDAGDIMQSLDGLTSIGRGVVNLPYFSFLSNNFRRGVRTQASTFGALSLAEDNSSIGIKFEDARKILFLVSAPKKSINVGMMEEISNSLQQKSPKAIIRMGDYPRRTHEISVTLIASQITRLERLQKLFRTAKEAFKKRDEIVKNTMESIKQLYSQGADLPTLD